jgi:hypothetical protein
VISLLRRYYVRGGVWSKPIDITTLKGGLSDEAEMHLDRMLSQLKKEQIQHRNRMQSVLIRYGLRLKQVGALSGLVGTPYNSGQSEREQGISHEGNPRVRSLAIELVWRWVRLQPTSK